MGFEVEQAEDGLAALELVRSWRPHLVLMDKRMPLMDGLEATRRIVAEGEKGRPILIALPPVPLPKIEKTLSPPVVTISSANPFREAWLFQKIRQHLGVTYVYEPIDERELNGSLPLPEYDSKSFSRRLKNMPITLLEDLKSAIVIGETDRLSEVLGRIKSHDSRLAAVLDRMVQAYDYEKVLLSLEECS